MPTKSLFLVALIALAIAPLHGQPVDGPVYWSPTPPDCSSLNETPASFPGPTGATVYSCYVRGTFVWLAAGGAWGTTIRVAAPASGSIGVDYTFYQRDRLDLSLDTTTNNDPSTLASGNDVNFALKANQPAEIEMLGATSDAPTYGNTAEGSVYAQFFCADATTCANVLPQLIYSALPSFPWSLSVPIAWDDQLSTQWSAEGIDDGVNNIVTMVIYNENKFYTTFTVSVYDSDGNLAASGTTPSIQPFLNLGGGNYGEAGTYAFRLSDLVSPLPSGVFKILIDGGSALSAVEVLQINGSSATTLQVATDTAPGSAADAKALRTSVRRVHAPSPQHIFKAWRTK